MLTPAVVVVRGFVLLATLSMLRTVRQSTVAVVTLFGKYRRVMREGLNVMLPWESVFQRLSLQNHALQVEFQAITQDQANVRFATMVIYAVGGADEETIEKAVFSFATPAEFQVALQQTIDGSIRQFVATTKQAESLGMRAEIVEHTKRNLDEVVSSWGYVVRDIQITDMTFDQETMDSMAKVVSSKNLLAAAADEGAALLVKRTKDAEAEAAYRTIGAEAEREAAALRGEGLALFRRNVADGMKEAAESLRVAGVDSNFLLFLEYTDALEYVADHAPGQGDLRGQRCRRARSCRPEHPRHGSRRGNRAGRQGVMNHQAVLLVGGTGRTGRKVLEQLLAHVRDCRVVVSCLGHVITLRGIFGPPRDLVTRAVARLFRAAESPQPPEPVKSILMSGVSVNQPGDRDARRGPFEKVVLSVIRGLVPPARDNQRAADFLRGVVGAGHPFVEWVAVRPDTLLDGDVSDYSLHEGVVGRLFAPNSTTMANVAHFVCELATDPKVREEWACRLPVIIDERPG